MKTGTGKTAKGKAVTPKERGKDFSGKLPKESVKDIHARFTDLIIHKLEEGVVP